MPRPTKPQFPEMCIGAALAKCPTLKNFGRQLMPTQGEVNFFTELQYQVTAIEPPIAPYPDTQMATGPRAPRETEI